jgi:hypothetical protein
MGLMQSVSGRTRRIVAIEAKPNSRWRLRLFAKPRREPRESGASESFSTFLLQELERHDGPLTEARQRLAELEADPETDELTLLIARHDVFLRRRTLADAFDARA